MILDELDPPARQLDSPLRFPVSNVFKGLNAGISGVGASGRVVSGIVQLGDKIQIVPGDETGIVRGTSLAFIFFNFPFLLALQSSRFLKSPSPLSPPTAIEQDGETVPWAVAGASVTIYLSGVEQQSIM